MQIRSINCFLRLWRPLPVSVESDIQGHGIAKEYSNRNPRNLEMMGIAHKRRGWKFQAPRKDFYHKLVLQREGKHISATLVHTSGREVINASTREVNISKHLPSTTDVNACYNIGCVIAQRCHQIGIDSMLFDPDVHGQAVDKFKEAVLLGGISLEEVEDQPYAEDEVGTDYDNPIKRPIDLDTALC